jgi:hypothetical protein
MEIRTMQELADWAKPFIVELASIYLPEILVDFRENLIPRMISRRNLAFKILLLNL